MKTDLSYLELGHNAAFAGSFGVKFEILAVLADYDCMAKQNSPFDYPIVIRQHMDFIVFSVPDLGISMVEKKPENGQITPEYMKTLATTLAKTWLKTADRLKSLKGARMRVPSASSTRQALLPKEDRGLTTPEVAQILGVSENTVRRMAKKGTLRCDNTDGGHRRFLESDVLKYMESQTPIAGLQDLI